MTLARRKARRRLKALIVGMLACLPNTVLAQEAVRPSTVNPEVRNGDTPYLVYGGMTTSNDGSLVVFLPGTDGATAGAPQLLLRMLADHGDRVIYLSYDDRVAGTKICPQSPPGCFADFRASRLYGGEQPVPTPHAEAIVPRLTDLLRYLDQEHPDTGWGQYLTADGPAWPRIVVSGLSQGAGMAAFLAKRYLVDRVVLFSSPWDFLQPGVRPAPWLFEASATPMDRWWAEWHVHENTVHAISQAYAALRIPRDHILRFDGPLPAGATGENPYHVSTVKMAQYMPQWRKMYGADQPQQNGSQ